MRFGETLRMAASNLWGHKVRSILTILGVIIGIGSVLGVVVIGASFEETIVSQFDSVDQKSIFVTSTLTPVDQGPPDCMTACNIFTQVDIDRIAALDGVERVLVSAELPASSLAWNGKELTFERLTATTPDADELREPSGYAAGKAFESGKPQLVLGAGVAQLLGNGSVQAGDAITVRFQDGRTQAATVAGVLTRDESLFGDRNGRVFVPVDPFYATTRASPSTGATVRVFSALNVVAADVRKVDEVRDRVTAFVEHGSDANRLRQDGQSMLVATADDIQASISRTFGQVTLFVGAIGGVSLVVGAIGIANIMLVSVTERTREIGVLKAIGAKNGQVLRLFLVESMLIGILGSVLAIGLGLGLGMGIVRGLFGIPPVIPYEWVGICLAIGLFVGAAAGFLPARRATRIQPIQALAYE
ncbi:MAG: putative transport system permease protein [Thermoplasmata archaeon]|jgi:putative ABC transport system permease protein|nr:putative transport system permease protein [Thermoplasmata archaeon]